MVKFINFLELFQVQNSIVQINIFNALVLQYN